MNHGDSDNPYTHEVTQFVEVFQQLNEANQKDLISFALALPKEPARAPSLLLCSPGINL